MIFPYAINAQISARVTFPRKADTLQKLERSVIVWKTGGLGPVQPQGAESKVDSSPDSFRHKALIGVGLADPVTKRRRLNDAALDLTKGQAAEQHIVISKNQERKGFVALDLLLMAADASAERCSRQIVSRP